jgi:hypothetical protein
MMSRVKVRSRLRIIGVNPYVLIDSNEASRLKKGWRGPMPVRFRINRGMKNTWRINMMPVGDGRYRLHLNGEVRKALNLAVGDLLSLDIKFDEEYKRGPQHPMPAWFGDKLIKTEPALRGWESLPPSRQKEILRYFARLKSDEAKHRNMRKALQVLGGGGGRFMGRMWNEDEPERK